MARRPVLTGLRSNATSVGILNWVLSDASGYLAGAPLAEDTVQSIRQIGEFINAYQPRQNQFLSSLVNRIGLVIVTTKAYSNPWEWVKKGQIDYGESIEEIYVNLAKVEDYKQGETVNDTLKDLFGSRKPDVQAAFHQMDFQKKYPVDVSEDQLRQAFDSMSGVTSLIDYIVQSLYTRFAYDELCMYKYMLGRLAIEGKIKAVKIADVNAANAKSIVSTIKQYSNEITFLKNEYNMAGVWTHTPKEDQYVIKAIDADAIIDVEVLASAFNMDKAEFSGRHVLLDTYDAGMAEKLNELLGHEDPDFKAFTEDEIDTINSIKFFLIDRDFIMQYDKIVKMTEQPLPNELKWKYFLHHWAIFSASPFKNAIAFTTQESSVTAIAVTPGTANIFAGQSLQFTANLTISGIPNQTIVWSITGANSANTKIDRNGLLSVAANETATSITVTAAWADDDSVNSTATVTVSR